MKKLFSIVLIVALCLSMFSIVYAEEVKNSYKISEGLKSAIEIETDQDKKIPVYIWFEDIDHEKVQAETEKILGINIKSFIEESEKVSLSVMQMEDAILEYELNNSVSKSLISSTGLANTDVKLSNKMSLTTLSEYTQAKQKLTSQKAIVDNNNALLNDIIATKRQVSVAAYEVNNNNFLEAVKISEEDIVFQSRYSPMVIANIPINMIRTLASMPAIEVLDIVPEQENVDVEREETVRVTVPKITVAQGVQNTKGDVLKSLGYTGAGIRIGIVERETGKHATLVREIIAGPNGYVPNATIYSRYANTVTSYHTAVENLLDMPVNLINVSQEVSTTYSYYAVEDRWADHVISQHNVIMITSAGNKKTITPPGMGYNVITVGGYTVAGSTERMMMEPNTYQVYSGYIDNSGYAEKPDIIAPCNIKTSEITDLKTGTSFAAPQVAGILAQLMQVNTNLIYRPSLAKAILMASAWKQIDYSSYVNCIDESDSTTVHSMSNVQGAGKVNANYARSVLAGSRYYYAAGGESSRLIDGSISVTQSDQTIRIATAWEKGASISGSNHNTSTINVSALTNWDLTLYTYSGDILSSQSTANNVELIEALPEDYGYGSYLFEVTRPLSNGTEWISVAWF